MNRQSKYFIFILGGINFSCSNPEISNQNVGYNYSYKSNNKIDSSQIKYSNPSDSILFQFGDGFSSDTVRMLTEKKDFIVKILKRDESKGYSDYVKLNPNTKEVKLNFNNGTIIFIHIHDKRNFFISRNNDEVEVLELKSPIMFR